MATWPLDVLDFCVPLDESAAQLEPREFVYAVRLTLENQTVRLHVFLYGQDAVSCRSLTFENPFHLSVTEWC